MRYLYYTLIIVLTLSLGSWLTVLFRPAPQAASNDLLINQRIITASEIEKRRNNSPYHFEGEDDFLEDLITRELLIQEAQRQKLDQDEQFRQSLQNYFEQSLLKIILDRQSQTLSTDLTQSNLNRFRENLQSHFSLKIVHYPDLAAAENTERPLRETTTAGSYLELPETLRDAVSQLAPGEASAPIRTGATSFRVTIIEKRLDQQAQLVDYSPAFIKEAALEEQQRQAIQTWLNNLRAKARISLPESSRRQGD